MQAGLFKLPDAHIQPLHILTSHIRIVLTFTENAVELFVSTVVHLAVRRKITLVKKYIS